MIYQIIETKDFLLAVSGKAELGDYGYNPYHKDVTIVESQDWLDGYKGLIKKIHAYYPLSDKQLDLPLLPEWDNVTLRVGRSSKRSVLDQNGILWVMFEQGKEEEAARYVELYNNNKKMPKQFEPIMIPEFNESSWHPLITETDGKTFLTGKYIF